MPDTDFIPLYVRYEKAVDRADNLEHDNKMLQREISDLKRKIKTLEDEVKVKNIKEGNFPTVDADPDDFIPSVKNDSNKRADCIAGKNQPLTKVKRPSRLDIMRHAPLNINDEDEDA